jgi:hypothetical protein
VTDAVQIELIRALAVVPASIGGIIGGWFSYKAAVHAKEAVQVSKSIQANTNGLSHALNDLTAKASHAEGVLDEKTRAESEISTVERAISNEAAKSGEAK